MDAVIVLGADQTRIPAILTRVGQLLIAKAGECVFSLRESATNAFQMKNTTTRAAIAKRLKVNRERIHRCTAVSSN